MRFLEDSDAMNLPRPKLLDRLILMELVPKLVLYIALFSTLFLTFGPIIAAARFWAEGVPTWVIAQFIGWDFAGFVSWTFPLGMMVAALLGFERLSRDSEAVALFAGGISFRRLIAPVFCLGLVVSLVGYVFNDRVASYANQRVADIKDHRGDAIGETTKPFHFENRKDGVLQATVQVEKGYDVQAKALRQVTITVYGPDGSPTQVFHADRAESLGSGYKAWMLFDGSVSNLGPTGGYAKFAQFRTQDIGKTPENMTFLQRDPETLNFSDLKRQIDEMKAGGGESAEIRNAEVGLWFKTSLPFSCLIFGLVGAPLGMRPPRSSRFSGTVWALPIIVGYYVIYMTLSNLARGGGVSPILAAWVPNILGLIVGAILIKKTAS